MLLDRLENFDFIHILRDANIEADNLANQAKDLQNFFVNLKVIYSKNSFK